MRFIPAFLLGVIFLAGPSHGEDPEKQESASHRAFATILEVLKSPRCLNCHPMDDHPRQGDDQHIHLFGVERGPRNHGGPVQLCATCHRAENNPYAQIPGAPGWGLAPRSMGWLGLSDEEIGRRLVDGAANGGRSLEALVHHMSEDRLVLWAWEPGEGREPPPVTLEEFRAALKTWFEGGGQIPQPSPREGEE